MSRLDEAKRWYTGEVERIDVIHKWMKDRQPPPPTFAPIVRDYHDKKEAPKRFNALRDDIQRVALVRMFSGFEADFLDAFSMWLKSALDNVHTAQAGSRKHEAIRKALPSSVKASIDLCQALEPRLSPSDIGWFHGLREYRNNVMHSGFPDAPPKEDPIEAHTKLRRILDRLTP